MLAKLIVEGKEFDIEILDPKLQELIAPTKKTGYERVKYDQMYWYDRGLGAVERDCEEQCDVDDDAYNAANYYSDATIAAHNTRADKLMRQLRRFAVEHRAINLNWKDEDLPKWSIFYDYNTRKLQGWDFYSNREFFSIVFDSKESVELAIETFHDELIWYFTEYKDSL